MDKLLKMQQLALDLENEVKKLSREKDGKIQINFNEDYIVVSGGYFINDVHRIFAWAVDHDADSFIWTNDDNKPELLLFVAL